MTQFQHFKYQDNKLNCENVSIEEIAQKQGTPLYIYSYQAIEDQLAKMTTAFKDQDHLICYSVKANPSAAILKTLFHKGCGADVVSGGELRRAMQAGCDPKHIVYSGVGKTSEEIHLAIQSGIMQFNVEGEQELLNIQRIAKFLDRKAPIAIRVNPDVDAKTHPYISTGLKKNKFGVSHKQALSLYKKAHKLSHIEITGISCHIGSQITDISPFRDAMIRVAELVQALKSEGIPLKYVDVGGGFGIRYKDENIAPVEEYTKAISEPFEGFGLKILLEPGRFILGNAGILVTKVIYTKQGEQNHNFTIVDAAFNDLKRPMLYDAWHDIVPVVKNDSPEISTNIEGPICETTDCFARDRKIQKPEPGQYLAIMSAGAYGMSMASTYNSRGRPSEVIVKNQDFYIIKKPDRLEDIMGREVLPEPLWMD